MPFILIKGRFKPAAGIPDGDSVRFKPDKLALLKKLEGRPATIGTGPETKGTVQLRWEGIDAIEKGAKQPDATDARQSLFDLIGYDAVNNPEPKGFILARMTDDQSGRPIAFAFAGNAPEKDGSEVFFGAARLRKSANFKQIQAGFAYPLYYSTLFAELRRELDKARRAAKAANRGVWKTDATMKGVTVTKKADLKTIKPIWPKLWRRLEAHFRNHDSLAGFVAALKKKNERIDLLDSGDETGLQDVVKVSGKKVALTTPPENIRVRADAGRPQ